MDVSSHSYLWEGSDTSVHINIIPSGEVKDSNVCCVRAYHQVVLAHTE